MRVAERGYKAASASSSVGGLAATSISILAMGLLAAMISRTPDCAVAILSLGEAPKGSSAIFPFSEFEATQFAASRAEIGGRYLASENVSRNEFICSLYSNAKERPWLAHSHDIGLV
jgi:hypothetical protein